MTTRMSSSMILLDFPAGRPAARAPGGQRPRPAQGPVDLSEAGVGTTRVRDSKISKIGKLINFAKVLHLKSAWN